MTTCVVWLQVVSETPSLPLLRWKISWQNHAFGIKFSMKMQISLRELLHKAIAQNHFPNTFIEQVLCARDCAGHLPSIWYASYVFLYNKLSQNLEVKNNILFFLPQFLQSGILAGLNWVPLVQAFIREVDHFQDHSCGYWWPQVLISCGLYISFPHHMGFPQSSS